MLVNLELFTTLPVVYTTRPTWLSLGHKCYIVVLATQALSAIEAPRLHYAERLTPPYRNESEVGRSCLAGRT
jgi:hypothetical protein